uniref:Death domain-containing protein n=1 Tax=Amphimedon queenslandica TaxID=400682 RepID=A0A1X7TAW4_AMPQE
MMTFQIFLLIALSFKVVSTNTLPTYGECLDITNLDEILQVLKDHNFEVAQWNNLCLELGIYTTTLNGIEAANQHHGVDRCLQKCLSFWLSKADKVKQKGGPTWHSLIAGLKRIDQIATADKIHEIHKNKHPACKILDRYISDPTVQNNLLSLTYLLHAEKIVNRNVWSSEEIKLLLNHVQNAVCQNYQLLKTFAAILQKSATTVTAGNAIMNEYKKEFTNEVNEPYERMTEEKGIHLDIVNFTEVRMEYATTFNAISEAIKSDDAPSLEELQTFLRRGYGYCKFPSQCESRKDIFDMIADECTLINIGLLESVVNFYRNEEAKHIIEQYKKYIDDFNQMKLHQFLDKKFFGGPLLKSETALFYVDRSIKESTLEDVRLLLRTAFTKRDQDVKVVVIREGNSYIITCSFPLHLSMELILSATENIEELKKKGLQQLTIGFSTVYDEVCEPWNELEVDYMIKMEKASKSRCVSVHEDATCRSSCGMVKQMAIYMSVKQLNDTNDHIYSAKICTKSIESSSSSWLLILLLLCIITLYVLFEAVLTDQRREAKSTQETPDKTKKSKKELKTEAADKEMTIAKLTKDKLKLKEELQSLSDYFSD